jgi:hypothetical protein
MKTYTKDIHNCKECPNIRFWSDSAAHDGPFDDRFPCCIATPDVKPAIPNVRAASFYKALWREDWENNIPDWCPL